MLRKLIAGLILASLAATVAAPAMASSQPNIVQRAIQVNKATGIFDTLLTAATCPAFGGAIVDALDGPEVVTLFAPTDGAFKKLGLNPGNVCSADLSAFGGLGNILTYHVIGGKVSYRAAVKAIGTSVTMANGHPAAITGTPWNLKIDGARVILPNVPASNGLIHVVNAVLLPD
jgi:uncharacterized surface protein with fasciclin (FAS1) repeats